ncbi:hypothetical protein R3X25_11585 [Lutibacter sp. TH_r2]|uniref:hypothetical protein n=1 Tax=Lutibacter sp. TH_r2 TaxID=3082083 RepID=UPI002953E82A|nr:hypothetical protein [Lutibacter sp. TH_r2]MDV7187924.1 hypothetical protein [Lutibacter sp. TH_r2]
MKRLELLIDTLNETEHLSGEKFNTNSKAISTFITLYGEELYKEKIESKNFFIYNPFYYPSFCIGREIKRYKTKLSEINNLLNKVKQVPIRNYLRLNLIEHCLNICEQDLAKNIILDLPDESKYSAHRLLLKKYALKGNLNDFKETLKLSKSNKSPRNDIFDSKKVFIENYSLKNGILKSLEICNLKIFGEKFYTNSLIPHCKKLSIRKIDEIIEKYPIIKKNEKNIKAIAYVEHFNKNKRSSIGKLLFEKTLNELKKVDKNLKFGDGRLKDFLLCSLGSSITNIDQINQCKKMIISPFYKKELNYYIKNIS